MLAGMPLALLLAGRYAHFLGAGAALGGALSIVWMVRAGKAAAAAEVVTKVELPGTILALAGGVVLVLANPEVFHAPWLLVKMALFFGALVLTQVKMFRLLSQARDPEAEALAKLAPVAWLSLLFLAAALFIAVFRFVLFG